jgi:hypothetical protein
MQPWDITIKLLDLWDMIAGEFSHEAMDRNPSG